MIANDFDILSHSLFSRSRRSSCKNKFTFHNCTSSPHLSPPFPGATGFSYDYSILDRPEQCPGTAGSSRSRLSPRVHGRNVGRCPTTRYCNRILPRISHRIRDLLPLPGASMYYRNNRSCPDRLYNETILLHRVVGQIFQISRRKKNYEFVTKILYKNI